MNYEPIKDEIQYWIDYTGKSDEYRKTHDRDCILTDGNLYADTLFSLWLPLRYTLNHCNNDRWVEIREKAYKKAIWVKDNNYYLQEFKNNLNKFLPEDSTVEKLAELFELGKTRANVIILPYRRWNNIKGNAPYWEYIPHFLFDLLNTDKEMFINTMKQWMKDEHLEMFFKDEEISLGSIRDLAGTGKVTSHKPANIDLDKLLQNYIDIIKVRQEFYQ